jgi:hypothetical protein
MIPEFVFRILMFVAFIAMFVIRIYFQSRVLHEKREINILENKLSLTADLYPADCCSPGDLYTYPVR